MKRAILLLFSFVSILSALIAAPIERTAALQLARQFLSQTSVSQFTRSSIAELESEPAYTAKDAMTGTPHFYVYNLSNDGGFVIVAADTRVRTILGYSFNGGFDEKNIPVNMREWLEEYSSQIAYAIKQLPETATAPVVTRGTSVNSVVVGPLLGQIQYNQGAPYNDLCPMDGDTRSVTGCVATAMAQVMRYYQHPLQGVGSKTYFAEHIGQNLTVDFSATQYDWANMLPKYSASATDEQKLAVATLMYHAGVAAEMDYSKDGSGAYTSTGALALYEHFDYDIGVSGAMRKYYSEEEWLQLIKTELNATRPVLMSGHGSAGGHAFVCDGYATNDFVHINWGWGGWKDGYFQISALNVDGVGDFNSNQSVFYAIQTPQSGSVANSVLGIEEITVNRTSISGGQTAQFNLSKVTGMSLFGFKGQLALALYDDVGNFVKIIKSLTIGNPESLGYGWYYALLSLNNIGIPDIRPNESTVGTFYIRPVCKPQGEDTWKPVLVENGKVSEIPAVITDSEINFFIPEVVYLIEVSANPAEGGTVTGGGSFAQGTSQTVTATANTGYTFTNWTENGTVVSTEPSYTFTVEQERSLVANFSVNKYEVTFVAPVNGTLKVFNGETEIESGTPVEYGTNLRVETLPDTGYELVSLQANEEEIINDTVTVTGVTEIVAQFAKQQFPVNFTQPAHGTLKVFHGDIEIESGTPVEYGTSLRVETVADTGCELLSLKANGQDVINDTVTVTGVTEIVAVFAKQQFPVNFTQPAHGTLKVFHGETEIESGTPVEYGTNLRVETVADTGYELVSLKANEEEIINHIITVTGVTDIVAVFAKQQFPVNFTQPAHGTLKVFNGETEIESGTPVEYGTSLRVETVADTGCELLSLQANGQDVTNDTVTVTGVTEIVAQFAKQQFPVDFTQPAHGTLKVFHGETEIESGTPVEYGTNLRLETVADTGYELVSLKANGHDVINDTVTVTGVMEIVAAFEKQQFPVDFTQPAHGTLKVFHGETEIPSGTPVEYGTNLRVETVADTGYELVSLKANEEEIINDIITVTGVTEIVAVFAKQQFPVNFTQPAHGTLKVFHGDIEIESGTPVEYGTSLRVETVADTGCELVSLQANGQAIANNTVIITKTTEIVAVFAKQQFPVNFTQPAHGTLKVFHGDIEIESGTPVEYGTNLRVETVADTGYELVSLKANGEEIINHIITVTGVTEIVAVFAKQQFPVNFTQPAHGTLKVFHGDIEIESGTPVEYGTNLRVETVADTGCELVLLKANGHDITNDTVTVTGVMEIVAAFEKQQFPVNFTQPAHGTLKVFHGETEIPSGTPVEYGTNLRVETVADTGYELASLKANEEEIINHIITVKGVTEIVAVFAKQQFPVNFTQPANGTLKVFHVDIEIESGTPVEYGTNLRVETVADTGYELASLKANGQAVTNDTVTVTGVTEIVAAFAKQQFPVNFTQPAHGTLKVFHGDIEIESGTPVEYGTNLRVETVADTGYEMASLKANGQAVTNDTVTVTGVTEIVAVFTKQQFPVNFTQPAHGTLKVYNGETEIESGVLVEYGTNLRVEALPGTGYKLVSLQANGQAIINDTVTVTGVTEIVAAFAKQQFPVNFTQPAHGTLKVFNGETELQSGSPVEYETKLRVEALPGTGYELVSLKANGHDIINDTVTVTGTMEIVAVFAKQQFPVDFTQPAHGTLKVFRGTTEIPSGTRVAYGAKLRVEAVPNVGYKLMSLQANGEAIINDTVTVTAVTEIVAVFAKQQFPVNFTQPANGTLKLYNGDTEIESGVLVEYGTKLRVEALPDVGYELVSLQANGEAIINDTVTITKATDIVAVFAKQQFPVNFTQPAGGTLKLYNGDTEIESGVLVEYGTKLRVEALPGTGYELVSLQANGQAITNDTVTVTGVTEIVAQFAKQQFPVNFTQPAGGTLKVLRGTTEIESGAQVEHGTKLRVKALPDTGYELVSLQANGQAVTNDTVTVTAATDIVAVFAKQQFPVNFTQPAGGTLKLYNVDTEIESGVLVEYGTKLRVEALPGTGYELVSLQANGQAVTNDTVTVTKATDIVAVFAKQQFPVSFTKPAGGTLKVLRGTAELQSGTQVEHGTKLRVEALPDVGYKLVSLQANGQAVTNDTVTVTKATEIKALFERWVSTDNYRVKATNAGCPGSNDGKIEVSFAKQLDYTVIVKNNSGFEKTERVTATTYSLTDLAAGNYSVCFTIEGATNYKQCFEVVISQPQDLSVFRSGVAGNHATYRVSGGTRYTVTHNGRRMETTGDVIEVPLRRGRNLIRITAESECQGVFEEELYHNDAHKLILFPNPTTGQFSLILPHGDEEVTVEIISLLGHSVMKEKRRVSHDGLISMNISALPKGIYLVRVNGKTVKHVTKVIKQ
ncbi:MAG: InlB B-repeat-containing protein [Fermentimonas sp.]